VSSLTPSEPPRRRTPILLILGLILLVLGIPSVVIGIVLLVQASHKADDNALARGTVGGGAMTFEQGADGRITIYLRSSSSNTETIDDEVDDTTCDIEHAGGSSTIDGSRQGFSVTLGHTATVGYVDVDAGQVNVVCDGGFSSGDELIVASGGPPPVVPGFVLIFAGAVAFIGGLVLTIIGIVLRASRRRRQQPPMPYTAYG